MNTYRLLTYRAAKEARAGLAIGDSLYDAARTSGASAFSAVVAILKDWTRAKRVLEDTAKRVASGRT